MKRGSTIFLKIAVFIIGIPVLAICAFVLPMLAKEASEMTEYAYVLYGFVVVMYLSAIPFYGTLYQAFKLLIYIDKNKAFSDISVKALNNIKKYALIISGLQVFGLPFFYVFAELDDAPGVVIVGMLFVFAPFVIAVFAAVLQRLLQEAIDIKTENDLIV